MSWGMSITGIWVGWIGVGVGLEHGIGVYGC